MRAAEERYPGYPATVPELMERAGARRRGEAMRAYPEARRVAVRLRRRLERRRRPDRGATCCARRGVDADETDDLEAYDVVIDALFGTGFRGEPRAGGGGADRADQRGRRAGRRGRPAVGRRRLDGRDRRRRRRRRSDGDVPRPQGRARRRAGSLPRRDGRRRRHRARAGRDDGASGSARRSSRLVPRRGARDTKYTARLGPRRRRLARDDRRGRASRREAALRADAGYVTLAVPEESLPVVEALALEPVKRRAGATAVRSRRSASAAERAGARARAGARPRRRARTRSSASCSSDSSLPAVVDADALFGLEPVRASAPDRAHAARGRARAAARARAPPGSTRTGSKRAAAAERFGSSSS